MRLNRRAFVDRFTQGGESHDYTSYLHTDWTNTMAVTSGTADGVDRPITACVTAPSHDEALLAVGERFHPYRWFLDTPAGEEPTTVVRDAAMEATIVTAAPAAATVGEFTPLDQKDWERYGLSDTAKRTQPRLEITSTGPSFNSLAVLVPGADQRGPDCTNGPTVTQGTRAGGTELVLGVDHRSGTFDRVTLTLSPNDEVDSFRIERRTPGRTILAAGVDPSQSDIDEEPLDEQLADDPVAAIGRVTGLPTG